MRNLRLISTLLILLSCLAVTSLPAHAGEKDESAGFSPFIQKKKYRSRPGPVEVRWGSLNELDAELTLKGYARIGIAEVRYVTRRCAPGSGPEGCTQVEHRDDPTTRLLDLAAESGGDLVVVTEDKKEGRSYDAGEDCIWWGKSRRYEFRTDWTRKYKTLHPVTRSSCVKFDNYREISEILISSGVVWRKDREMAKRQQVSMELAAGAGMGDFKVVRRALDDGANVNLTDIYGNLPLARAVFNGHEEMVRYLIGAGADVNIRGIRQPPLYQAAEGGQPEIFQLLLDKGAKTSYKDPATRETLLHAAARGGSEKIVRALLARKVEADATDSDGVTPLMQAAASGSEGAARLLIDAKARVDRKSRLYNDLVANWSPIHFAAYLGDAATLKVLLESGADGGVEESRGNTPVQLATMSVLMALVDFEAARTGIGNAEARHRKRDQIRERKAAVRLLKAFIDGVYGYIDRSGQWVIKPVYRKASRFSQGLGLVEVGGKWGYINPSGKIVIKPVYQKAYQFYEGRARITVDDDNGFERNGFIDRSGRMAIPAKFARADRFSEGMAPAQAPGQKNAHGKYGYIDKTGRWVIEPIFAGASIFSEGLAGVSRDGRKWGFIDKSGQMVIEPGFDFDGTRKSMVFSQGRAAVNLTGRLYGFIDKTGQVIVPARFKETFTFSEGLAAALEKRWGFIDLSGNWAIPQNFSSVDMGDGFSEGRCAVAVSKEKWAYIDRTGSFISQNRYEGAGPFRNGMAWVKMKDQWGLIDRDEKFLIEPVFSNAAAFSEGLAVVQIKGKALLPLLD